MPDLVGNDGSGPEPPPGSVTKLGVRCEGSEPFLDAILLAENAPQLFVCLGEFGLGGDGLSIACFRLDEFALHLEDVSKIAVRLCIVRSRRDCAKANGFSVFELALLSKQRTEIAERLGIFGLDCQRAPKRKRCFIEFFLLQQNVTAIVMCFCK